METKVAIGLIGTWIVLAVTSIAGYITNFITALDFIFSDASITLYLVCSVIGMFIPPMGALLGVLSWFGIPY
jgi:hypothetical protein